jgi:hypothetical protein
MSDISFKLFDNILKTLSNNYGKELSVLEIAKNIYPNYYFGKQEFPFEITNVDNQHSKDIINSLNFLDTNGYVNLNVSLQKVSINTKGLIKIRTEGFQKEYNRIICNNILQRWTWIILPLAGLITAGVSIARIIVCNP